MPAFRRLPALIVTSLLAISAWAQTATFREGVQAFEAGRFPEAAGALAAVPATDPHYAEAQYYLARLFLQTPLRDPDRAKEAIENALRRDPDNVRYLEVELWRRYFHTASFLPLYQAKKRIDLAERILEREPENAVAHFVLGAWAYEGFRQQYHGVQFPGPGHQRRLLSEEAAALTDAAYLLEPRLVDTGDGPAIAFVDAIHAGFEVPVTSMRRAGREAYAEALHHLRRALAANPAWPDVYAVLAAAFALRGAHADAFGVLDTMRIHLPDRAETWLYRGYFEHRTGRYAAAAASFDEGLARLPAPERRAFLDVAYFLPLVEQVWYEADSAGYAAGFWESRDPRYLTPVNERLLEHFARLVYADLRFGDREKGLHGWETEPGQVIVRYGEPPAEARYGTRSDAYLIFHYGDDLYFKFMDLARGGHFTFYSPSALDFAGFKPARGLIENDFAVRGPETFRKRPDRFTYEPPGRVAMPYLTGAFRGSDGKTDLYVAYGIPVEEDGAGAPAVRAGAFLIRGNEGVVHAQSRLLDRRTAGASGMWVDACRLSVEPGTYTLALEFEPVGGGDRVGQERERITVPGFAGTSLQLSDVLLAYTVEEEASPETLPGWISRRGLAIRPAPGRGFSVGQPVYLYFEVYGLQPAPDGLARYAVEAVLVRSDEAGGLERLIRQAFGGAREAGVSVRFEGQSRSREDGQYLVLDTTTQPPGRYVLVLRLTDLLRNETVERRRTLQLG
ncbi:MAG: hypothetical protein KatS3mg043_0302 [Rhodothermaceae bacterium]|nr:MAG: hypothetical protein KatS3mg043_0302 [Rhodothermaceae bacterium]